VKRWTIVGALLVIGLVGAAVVGALPDLTARTDQIPTTRATRGDVVIRVHATGELSARRSVPLVTPPVGATLQIVKLLPPGATVEPGDVVIEFDRAEQQYNLQQAESELAEADEELVKLRADAKVQAATDQLNLLHARYELRRAQIAVTGNEFVGRIEAEKNLLAVEEARRSLAQIEGDVTEHATGSRAGQAVQEEKRAKASITAELARRNIESMTVTAPIAGLIVPRSNQNAANGFYYTGMTLPDFREGDTANPGQVIADIVDLSEMEIRAKVPETERPLLTPGAPTQVEMEALPGAPLAGTAKGVAGLAQHSMWDTGTSRQFDAAFALNRSVPGLRPGMTAQLVVEGETLSNVMHLPRQALFERNGKPVVFVADGAGFKPVEVKVVRMTETRVVLQDFPADVDVALVNPESRSRRASGSSAAAPLPGGTP
jgi:HlyD family secretion protein